MSMPTNQRPLALITGASSGIGEGFARLAASKGYDVALAARRLDRLEALAKEIRATWPVDAFALQADLVDPETPHRMIADITSRGRSVDTLINNAGFSIAKGFAWTDLEAQKKFLAVTIEAPIALSHLVLPQMMKKQSGRIINISSITAFSHGGKGHTLYPAGKSFLVKFSQSLNEELKPYGINVSAVCPGFVKTEFMEVNNPESNMRDSDAWFWQSPEEIATESWRRNERGAEVIVPGIAPKCIAAMMKYLPEQLVAPLTRKAAAEHYVGDGDV